MRTSLRVVHFRLALRFAALCTMIALHLVLCLQPSRAQTSFERTYGSDTVDAAWCARQTSDGGYVVAGLTSIPEGDRNAYLVRTDSVGDTIWTRTYGGPSWEDAQCIQETSDGNYILVGYTQSFGMGQRDVYLIKTDDTGNELWFRTYGDDQDNTGHSVQETGDGGYVIAGETGQADVYLVRADSLGGLLWERTYGDFEWDWGASVDITDDGGFVVVGGTQSFGAGGIDIWLIKTDSSGGVQWDRTFGGVQDDYASAVQQTSDSGYIIAGQTRSFGPAFQNGYLLKLDRWGALTWDQVYSGGENSYFSSVDQTADGMYVAAGTKADSHGASRGDVYVVRVDSTGGVLWERTYGGISDDYGYSVEQTADGGYVISGLTTSFGMGEADVYLMKLGPDGAIAKDASVLSLDAPPDTVYCDSVYGVRAMVTNLGDALFSFNVVATLNGYADTAQVLEIMPDSVTQVQFRGWQVPSPDSSSYTMRVCTYVVGDIDTTNDCMQKEIFAYNPTGVEERLDRRGEFGFHLYQNKPNPFHRSTVIQYSLATQCDVTLSVYDVTGSLVHKLVDELQGPGFYRAHWDPQGCADGIYFCRLTVGNLTDTRTMVLVR